MNKKQIDEIECILMYYYNYQSWYKYMEFEDYVNIVIDYLNKEIREG